MTPFPNRLPSEANQRFQREQSEATWVIGMLAALLAAAVSIFWRACLLAPARRLASATHRLSAGDYATRVNVTSADELGRLGQDFNRLACTLERNEALRREMVADISHELRTPLAVLRGEMKRCRTACVRFSQDALASAAVGGLVAEQADRRSVRALAGRRGALSYRMLPVDMAAIAEQSVDDVP